MKAPSRNGQDENQSAPRPPTAPQVLAKNAAAGGGEKSINRYLRQPPTQPPANCHQTRTNIKSQIFKPRTPPKITPVGR